MEQVNLLERKVKDAVNLIQQLRNENEYLRNRLGDYEVRIQELESLLSGLKASQTQIEEGILNAIADLNGLEGASVSLENRNKPYPASSDPVMFVTDEPENEEPALVEEAPTEPAPVLEDNWDLTDGEVNKSAPQEDTTNEEPGLGIF